MREISLRIRGIWHLGCVMAFGGVLITACGGTATQAGSTAGQRSQAPAGPTFELRRVLRGPDGLEVRVAEFGSNEALVEITGVQSAAANVVLRCELNISGDRTEYRTQWDGRDYVLLLHQSEGGWSRWQVAIPEQRDGAQLAYDEERSNRLNTEELYSRHVAQTGDGTLESLQTFNREAARARNEERLAEQLGELHEACGSAPEWSLGWDTISDDDLRRHAISGYCGSILEALEYLCRFEPGRRFAQEQVTRIECEWSTDGDWSLERGFRATGGTIHWRIGPGASNLRERAEEALRAQQTTAGITLAAAISLAQTDVCVSPDQAHVVVVHPHREDSVLGISYGTSTVLYHTPQPASLGRGWFFDPRQYREQNNSSFRGRDLRYYSHVDVDREAGTCAMSCGTRDTEWTLLPPSEAQAILRSAETRPAALDREPHALARDEAGNYYYVDRGNTEATRRDFRVYRGRPGRMERVEMRDVVSDSEGDIFSTARGNLRLMFDSPDAQWMDGSRRRALRQMPVHENYRLITSDLGIYRGQRFELPCDDY